MKIHDVKWGTEKQGGTRVRLSDAGWKEPLIWNRKAAEGQCQDCNGGKAHRTHESGFGYEHCETCGGTGRVEPYRSRVFCASLADVFESWDGPILNHSGLALWRHPHDENPQLYLTKQMNEEWVPVTMDDLRADLFRLIDATPNLDWMILTKRPENIRRMWPENAVLGAIDEGRVAPGPLRNNCWLGTSCSDQATFDVAWKELAKCTDLSPVRFFSLEPLLGPIDMHEALYVGDEGGHEYAGSRRNFFQLAIVGGESGPNARPCNVAWIRDIVAQCKAAGAACFVKQLGSRPVEVVPHGEPCEWIYGIKDPKGGNIEEWPEDLRVRQMPRSDVK